MPIANELVLNDPEGLKQDIKKRNQKVLTYLLTRVNSCPSCAKQEQELEPHLSKLYFKDITKVDLDASEGNNELARDLNLVYTPSFLFVVDGKIMNVDDPYAEECESTGEKSRSLLGGLQGPETLQKIYDIIKKNPRGFEAIMQRGTCESCNLKPICLLNHVFHFTKCKIYWRSKKFDVFPKPSQIVM